jgi:uncharacterized protein YeaO (DUF488 family)
MSHGISAYLYGSPRRDEGLRIGTTRYVPRGVRRGDWQKKGYFDVWVPLLSPEPENIKEFLHGKMTFDTFSRRYRTSMKKTESRQVIELLAGISLHLPIAVGCFCKDESHCHRSILKQLIEDAAKRMKPGKAGSESLEQLRYASPVCYADWEGKEDPTPSAKKTT